MLQRNAFLAINSHLGPRESALQELQKGFKHTF